MTSAATALPGETWDRPPGRPPGRPRNERASEAISEATLRQLDRLGFGQMTMESIALEAGVSRATIYRRYRDKADVVTDAIAGAAVPVQLASHRSDDPRRDLIRFLEAFDGRFAESCLEVIGGLVGDRSAPHALEMHRERVVKPRTDYALSLLVEAQRRGELAADADLGLAMQMLAGSVFFRRVSGQQASPGWAEQAVQAIWRGMAPAR
ncbi:MAG TPA: TetR/AcrR family transcriptional regulator [Acidimicrobiales bacterium]|nr:TetR/AcrR family transcriptional regulator [Acidimicrobiales bacterium]